MCRIPKVVIVAPAEHQAELRKKLSALEYDITAAVTSPENAAGVSADIAVAWEPDEATLMRLREMSLKTVAVGGEGETADMKLDRDDLASFKTRIWELFRPD